MAFNLHFTFDHFYRDPLFRWCEGRPYLADYKRLDLDHKLWRMYSLWISTLCSKIPAISLMFLTFAFEVKTFWICFSVCKLAVGTVCCQLYWPSCYTFPNGLERCYPIRQYGLTCSSVTKFTGIMDLEVPISPNICTLTKSTNVQIVKVLLTFIFKWKKSEFIRKFRSGYLAKTLADSAKIAVYETLRLLVK